MVLNTINCYLREMEKNKHSPFKNYAFISYNSLDRREAEKLQRKLEHYKLPKTTRNEIKDSKYLRDIWRDVTNLRGDIDEEIRKQLSLSKYLIVICSPNSANPLSYVNKEVDYYANILGRGDYIIPYIIKGVPYSNNPDTECFPKALRDYNLNHNKNIYGYDVNDLGHSLAFIKVVAEMLDVDVEMLWQRFKRDRRKRIARRIVVTLLLFIIMLYIWRPVRLNFTLEDKNHSSLPEMRDAKLIVNNREYHVDGNNLTVSIYDLAATYRGRYVPVKFRAIYYENIDTLIKVGFGCSQDVKLALRRDDTFAIYSGYVFDEWGGVIPGALVEIGRYVTKTDSSGNFRVVLPPDSQSVTNHVRVSKVGKEVFESEDEWPRDSIRYVLHNLLK